MFADETNIFATGYCPLLLSNTLKAKLQNGFSANPFSVNLNKTCFMIFSKRKMPIATQMIRPTINGLTVHYYSMFVKLNFSGL